MRILNFEKFVLNEEETKSPIFSSKKIDEPKDDKKDKVTFDYEGKTYDFTEIYKKLGLV